jgi:hypothetical protein
MNRLVTVMILSVLLFPGRGAAVQGAAPPWSDRSGVRLLSAAQDSLLIEMVSPEVEFEPVSIDDGAFAAPRLAGASLTAEAGMPELPFYPVLLGVPPEAQISLFVVEIDTVQIPGERLLPPAPQPVQNSEDLQPGAKEHRLDGFIERSAGIYPSAPVRLAQTAWLRDQRLARLEIYPLQYLPASRSLVWHRRILLEVKFLPENLEMPSASAAAANSPFETVLKGALLNYDQARSWRSLERDAFVSETMFEGAPAAASAPEPPVGVRYRIAINQDGLYRLTYAALQGAGFDVATLDPTLLHLDSQGQQAAIYVHNADGDEHKLSPGEYLVFYGEKFSGDRLASLYQGEDDQWLTFQPQSITGTTITWVPEFNAAMLEKYTNENVYWLYVDSIPGLRMQVVNGTPAGAPIAASYIETVQAEQSNYWRTLNFTSEDTWYWDRISHSLTTPTTRVYTTTLSAVSTQAFSATVRGEMIAETNNNSASPDHHTILYLNDPAHTQPDDDRTWDGKSRYRFEFQVPGSQLIEGINQLDLQVYKTAAVASELVYFDKFEIEYERLFQAAADVIDFSQQQSGLWRYQIGGFSTSSLGVLEITYPLTPTWITGAGFNFGVLDFQANASAGDRYFAGKYTDLAAAQILRYDPPDFSQPADYLVITHHEFITPSLALADYRRLQGLSALVVEVADLYNQFNYGIYHPIAIKNFFAYTFSHWADPPDYAVLVGDGTWNFHGTPVYNSLPIYMPPNLAWVDPYQGEVDSANLLAAVVGDDPLPDLMIARMPVNSTAEMQAIIDKTVHYESLDPEDWQRNMLFIADNVPDPAGDFVQAADDLIADYLGGGYNPQRIYLNNYFEDPPGDGYCDPGSVCPPVNRAITTTLITTGTLLVNYLGHADIRRWAAERIFINDNLNTLDNLAHLPVILSMTCLDGYWIHPGGTGVIPGIPSINQSIMEDALRAAQKGSVASFSPTGLGVASGHDELQRGFYDALLLQGSWILGQASMSARLRLYAAGHDFDLLHTFTIFGDPALRLPSPYDLAASPSSQAESGPPGGSVSYTLSITNTGSLTDTYLTEVLSGAWSLSIPPSLTLPAGSTQTLPVQVSIPAGAADGDSDTAVIAVRSAGDTSRVFSGTLTTTAYNYGVRLEADVTSQSGRQGETVQYDIRVYNNGAFVDSIDLTVSGSQWPVVTIPAGITTTGALQPGEYLPVSLRVQIPLNADLGAADAVEFKAASHFDPARIDSLTLTTALMLTRLYLPEIEN